MNSVLLVIDWYFMLCFLSFHLMSYSLLNSGVSHQCILRATVLKPPSLQICMHREVPSPIFCGLHLVLSLLRYQHIFKKPSGADWANIWLRSGLFIVMLTNFSNEPQSKRTRVMQVKRKTEWTIWEAELDKAVCMCVCVRKKDRGSVWSSCEDAEGTFKLVSGLLALIFSKSNISSQKTVMQKGINADYAGTICRWETVNSSVRYTRLSVSAQTSSIC